MEEGTASALEVAVDVMRIGLVVISRCSPAAVTSA